MIKMIKNLFKIAKLLSVDDSGVLQFATVSMLGKEQKVLMFTPYGLMSNPPVNSMVALFSQQGQESNGVGMADDPNNRIFTNLLEGEVAIGNYLTGDYAKFDAQGNITVKSIVGKVDVIAAKDISLTTSAKVNIIAANDILLDSSTKITLDAPYIVVSTTDFRCTSTIFAHNLKNIGATHKHSGVTTGAGNTGNPI